MKTTYIKFPHKDADKRLREALDQLRRERIRSIVLGVIAAGLAAVIAVMCTYQLATLDAAAVKTEADKPEITLTEPVEPVQIEAAEPEKTSVGTFYVTGYVGGCAHCCGNENNITASGVPCVAGVSCATGPEFEFGTVLEIEDIGTFVVEDRGVGNGHIDVACATHEECYAITGYYEVYVYEQQQI